MFEEARDLLLNAYTERAINLAEFRQLNRRVYMSTGVSKC